MKRKCKKYYSAKSMKKCTKKAIFLPQIKHKSRLCNSSIFYLTISCFLSDDMSKGKTLARKYVYVYQLASNFPSGTVVTTPSLLCTAGSTRDYVQKLSTDLENCMSPLAKRKSTPNSICHSPDTNLCKAFRMSSDYGKITLG